ncbi:LytR/AlgR family response regulator transcription factor [Saccharicrinis aurantiacus]|uniref:LytR/AlgR family response regulator transcription factor n=1 Tax=Saccharicrinis aurantiacus TaxID=1849719 RepID=UPI002492B461|nr:LytTR family DNA-binding domain-containing protein [Saccharicrinis aurantiacus]
MNLNNKIPTYFILKKNITNLVLFTAGFALLFINLYSPFDVKNWFGLNLKSQELFFYSSLIILTGVLVVVVSRVLLYQYNKREIRTTMLGFALIIAAEVMSMSLFYTFYEAFFITDDDRSFLEVFNVSFQNTTLVLLLPYAVMWLYFSYVDKIHKLKILTEQDEEINSIDSNSMVLFKDEKGTMRISLKLQDLLYIKATDNYVTIFYVSPKGISRHLLRNTIKNIEKEFIDFPLKRCHRSYMVNFDKVKIIRREKGGLILEMETDPIVEVPVSKTYMDQIFELFKKN